MFSLLLLWKLNYEIVELFAELLGDIFFNCLITFLWDARLKRHAIKSTLARIGAIKSALIFLFLILFDCFTVLWCLVFNAFSITRAVVIIFFWTIFTQLISLLGFFQRHGFIFYDVKLIPFLIFAFERDCCLWFDIWNLLWIIIIWISVTRVFVVILVLLRRTAIICWLFSLFYNLWLGLSSRVNLLLFSGRCFSAALLGLLLFTSRVVKTFVIQWLWLVIVLLNIGLPIVLTASELTLTVAALADEWITILLVSIDLVLKHRLGGLLFKLLRIGWTTL